MNPTICRKPAPELAYRASLPKGSQGLTIDYRVEAGFNPGLVWSWVSFCACNAKPKLNVKTAKEAENTMIWMASREVTLNKLSTQADNAMSRGDLKEAERLYREIVDLTATTFGRFDPDYAHALNDLAKVLEAQQKYGEAINLRARIANVQPLDERNRNAV